MDDIFQDLPIKAPIDRVFGAVSTPNGLDSWWTKRSSGAASKGSTYELWFGPEHDWRATVTKCSPNTEFELNLVDADADWTGTRVAFHLDERSDMTWVHFAHTGWPSSNEHYRVSCNCWALYLRLLRRYLEHGEFVPYEERLDA